MGKFIFCFFGLLLLGPLGLIAAILWVCLRPRPAGGAALPRRDIGDRIAHRMGRALARMRGQR